MFRMLKEESPQTFCDIQKQLSYFEKLCKQLLTLPQMSKSKQEIDERYIKALQQAQQRLQEIDKPSASNNYKMDGYCKGV